MIRWTFHFGLALMLLTTAACGTTDAWRQPGTVTVQHTTIPAEWLTCPGPSPVPADDAMQSDAGSAWIQEKMDHIECWLHEKWIKQLQDLDNQQ